MRKEYSLKPIRVITTANREIPVFSVDGDNIDSDVVKSFGEEWLKFQDFSDETIKSIGDTNFDILTGEMINKNTYAIDFGCGTGRWSKYLADKVGYIEAIDPSDAVLSADVLLKNVGNIRIAKASIDNIPFEDNSFDFGMSVGVLHHIPDTQKALSDCVKKIKPGGYFYCYLYYNLDNRGAFFNFLFNLSNLLRRLVSSLPAKPKKVICDILAVVLYMPFVWFAKFLNLIGLKRIAKKIPLYDYTLVPFFIIRNDSLDRFGTKLEQRFSKEQVINMMMKSGLKNIIVGSGAPYYHAVGEKA